MRITKESQSNTNLINTIRNLNKLNPTPNIDLSNLHSKKIGGNISNPIKVKLMKNQNKLPVDFIYNDQKDQKNQKEINDDERNSLIYTQEKNFDKNKDKEFFKKISMSPKLVLKYGDNDDINTEIKANNKLKNTPKKNKYNYNLMGLLSKNYAYNKKKPSNALNILNKKKEQELNNNLNDDNISVVSFNSIMTDVNAYNTYIQRNNQQNKNNMMRYNQNRNINQINNKYEYYNNMNNNFEIKSEDLIMLEERLNDISISLNNINDVNDVGASNECVEFFVFYFHSSLNNKFALLFHEQNRILIQSAINLKLLTIVMTYHLSMNLNMLLEISIFLKNIFTLLKNNLYLLIRKIQIFYGNEYVLQNQIYFKTFNYILSRNGFDNLNENEICNLINNNCIKIAQYLSEIIIYYEEMGNNYYLDFLDLFNNISKLTEKEINVYFYNYLYSAKSRGQIPKPKMEYQPLPSRMRNNRNNNYYINNQTINNYNNININNINQPNKNYNNNQNQMKIQASKDKIINEHLKNKISPPFLLFPCAKKYTLVLDITNTLINIKYADQKGQVIIPYLRPGIFSFLNSVKPIFELVSFSLESKEFSDIILNEIEKNKKYFDFNLYKDHATLYGNRFVKDLTKLGRDIRKIIIVDDDENNFVLNKENGIKIKPYLGEENNDDTSLFELKKILILFERMGLDDIRKGIKIYEKDIKEKITLNNLGK